MNRPLRTLTAVSVPRHVPLTKYIHCALTGKVIAQRMIGYGSNDWDWIANAVADWESCEAADVGFLEADDNGPDRYTVKGEVVAYQNLN